MTKIEESIHSTTVEMESSRLMKLPFETLEAIFSHVDPEDLVSLCLVSRSVREYAASRLYRSLECILQPKSDLEHKWPIDRLAKELETLTTSDFNYAAYIKSICLDTAPLTDDNDYQFQEQIADQFKYDTPCGKFFNNLLLASIKRISTLESFRWNAGLELNPAVFAALAKIPSLQHICVRMPAGVEPIQKKSTPAPPTGPPTQPLPLPVQLNQIHMHSAPPMASVHHLSHNSTGCRDKFKSRKYWDPTQTFSHFNKINTLEVLEMDNLGYIDEISKCILQSSGTLKHLKLSFSERLALSARKKKDEEISETSSVQDEEELYQPLPPPPPGQPAAFTSSSSRNSEVRRERLAQEQVLARLFGLDIDKNAMSQKESNELVDSTIAGTTKGLQVRDDADVSLINDLKLVLEKLNTQQPKYQAVIAEIEKVTGPYQDSGKEPGNETQQGEQSTAPPAASSGEKGDDNAVAADGNKESKEHEPKSGDTDTLVTGDAEDMDLEKRLQTLVDMEHPDDISEGEDQEFVDEMIDTAPRCKAMTNGTVHVGKSKGKGPTNNIPADNDDHSINEHDVIHNYVRQNHGISLDSLSIYLVPAKPSVLCRGINVWTLRHISLLNVGPQRALWATLENLNSYNPIPLVSVHTDNVTSNLLSFLSGLQRLEELFMIERSTRSRVEPSTPKPTVTVEGMRDLVLTKHIGTLKRLMIRNDNDLSWALDPASVLLIARNGHKLIELVAHLGSRCFHLLMRHMSTMESLSVLHVLFSDPDYCVSVLDEVRESAIDNFAHYSSVKEVYIGVSYASGGPVQTRCTFMKFRNKNSLTNKESRTFDSNDNDAADIDEDFIHLDPSTCVILSEVAHFEDTPGVKVWKKENWNLML
ncbi:F-box domain-containing protein [Trichophyton interdigitale]|nr:F-box domain-containing protein [Trichophyton interdigitale]KAG5217354.1 F-box domain-containing protein [Trichophyton interdigitale]